LIAVAGGPVARRTAGRWYHPAVVNSISALLLESARKILRRAREKAGLVSGFSDIEMHLWMLSDAARGDAFDRALRRAITPGSVVCDVGAGTGLLSMMACRAGASKVYAIEETRVIDLAMALARENGYSERIVFLRGNSRAIELPERADVVVSETIGSFVFSEEIVSTLADARSRFLKPSGVLIPNRIQISLAPVESFEEGIGFWERPIHGLDYRSAAAWVATGTAAAAKKIRRAHFLAEARVAYDLDFKVAEAGMNLSRSMGFPATRAGTLHGFVGFWEADLHESVSLRCEPGGDPVHWPPILFRLSKGAAVRPGDVIHLDFGRKKAPGWSWHWRAEVRSG